MLDPNPTVHLMSENGCGGQATDQSKILLGTSFDVINGVKRPLPLFTDVLSGGVFCRDRCWEWLTKRGISCSPGCLGRFPSSSGSAVLHFVASGLFWSRFTFLACCDKSLLNTSNEWVAWIPVPPCPRDCVRGPLANSASRPFQITSSGECLALTMRQNWM